jgi:hypothetical protein
MALPTDAIHGRWEYTYCESLRGTLIPLTRSKLNSEYSILESLPSKYQSPRIYLTFSPVMSRRFSAILALHLLYK